MKRSPFKTNRKKLYGSAFKQEGDIDYSYMLPAEFAETESDMLDYDWEKYGAPEYKKGKFGRHTWKTPKYHWEDRGQISDKAIQETVKFKEKKDRFDIKQKQKVFELSKKGKYKKALAPGAQPYRLHLPMPGYIPEKAGMVLGGGIGGMFAGAKAGAAAVTGGAIAGSSAGALIPSIPNLLNIQSKKLSDKKWLRDWQKKGTPEYVRPFTMGKKAPGPDTGSGKAKLERHGCGFSVKWGSKEDLETGKVYDPSEWKGKTRLKPLIPGTKGKFRAATDYIAGQWYETPLTILPKQLNPFNPTMTKRTQETIYKPKQLPFQGTKKTVRFL